MKNKFYLIVITLAVTSLTFKFLNKGALEQTSLLFVGIPLLITIMIIRHAKKPKTAYGMVSLVITLFLLISGIFLGEGFICILLMAPIFYAVGLLVTAGYLALRKSDQKKTKVSVMVPLLILAFQPLEYISPLKTHTIETTKEVNPNVSFTTLNTSPKFTKNMPLFFQAGFPKPIAISGNGTSIGDQRIISFKSSTKGIGELVLEIKEKNKNSITFSIIKDHTHIAHWLTYKEVKVKFTEENNTKMVTWTTKFTCDLGPSWYFEPFEKYAINLMNEHLINSYFNIK